MPTHPFTPHPARRPPTTTNFPRMDQSNPTPDPRASILAPNASELTITVPGISPTETSLRLSPLPPSLSMSFPLGGMTPASISGVTGHAPMLSTMSSYSIGLGPSDLSLTSVGKCTCSMPEPKETTCVDLVTNSPPPPTPQPPLLPTAASEALGRSSAP